MVISTVAAFLFLKYAPFSFLFKLGVVFSYFFLYEYNIISRGYNITWLLLIMFCILFTSKKRNYLLLSINLFLLANVHLFSLFLSLPLFILVIDEYKKEYPTVKEIIACTAIFVAGIAFSLIAVIPPHDSSIIHHSSEDLLSFDRFSKTTSFFVKGLYPLPDIYSYYYRNSNFLVKNFKVTAILITVMIFAFPVIFLRDKRPVLFFFYVSALFVMIGLFVLKLFTGVHYMGYAFMILITTLWLAANERLKREYRRYSLGQYEKYIYKPLIGSILICQVCAGFFALFSDYKRPFSESKAVANYIGSSDLSHPIIISVPFATGTAIAGYMNSKIFYPELNRFGTFWNWTPLEDVGELVIMNRIKRKADSLPFADIAITIALDCDSIDSIKTNIRNYFNQDGYSIKEQKDFLNAIIRGENYTVYVIKKQIVDK